MVIIYLKLCYSHYAICIIGIKLFDGNTFYMQRTMNGAFAETAKGMVCTHETVERSIPEI